MRATVLENTGRYLIVEIHLTGGIESIDLHSIPVGKSKAWARGNIVEVKEEKGNPFLILM